MYFFWLHFAIGHAPESTDAHLSSLTQTWTKIKSICFNSGLLASFDRPVSCSLT